MTKIVLLTGFLGAGKTTLLKSILKEYQKKKIGIIINEFGKVNVDARLVEKEGVEMAEVSNGSIFCACLKENFVESLIEMINKNLEYLFIEASGLADPSSMNSLLVGIRSQLRNTIEYKGAICIVDGEHFAALQEVLPALANQVEYSSWVLINKVDLITRETLMDIENIILKINPEASVIPTIYCKTDYKYVIEQLSDLNKEARESTNTLESRPRTFILKEKGTVLKEKLVGFLKEVAGNTYRIKGFVKTSEGNMEISCVGGTIELLPWEKEIESCEITVISAVGPKIISIVADAMAKHLDGEISF